MFSKMPNATCECMNGTNVGVTSGAVTNGFTAHCILLIGVSEEGEGSGSKFFEGGRKGVKPASTGVKDNVAKTKRGAASVVGRFGVLARTTQIKERYANEVGDSDVKRRTRLASHNSTVSNEGERNGFHAVRLGVDDGVTFQLLLETELDVARGNEAVVFGPHPGHRLTDGT